MPERSKMRPGDEWKRHDHVCPIRLARQGYFVEGSVVIVIPLPEEYHPPASYEWQNFIYIVEWSAPSPGAPYASGHGVFLGNDLMTYEQGIRCARAAIKQKKTEAIEALRLGMREAELRAALAEYGTGEDNKE